MQKMCNFGEKARFFSNMSISKKNLILFVKMKNEGRKISSLIYTSCRQSKIPKLNPSL